MSVGGCLEDWWSQEMPMSAASNHDNPVNGNHPGTITLLICGNQLLLTTYQHNYQGAGQVGQQQTRKVCHEMSHE